MTDKINLLLVCDNHYISLLASLLKSIETHHNTEELIVAYIVSDKISQKNKEALCSSLNLDIISIVWIDIKNAIPNKATLPLTKNSYPLNIITRIYLSHYIPITVNRILYLDVDMIMCKDVSELYFTDLEGHTIGAVMDSITKKVRFGIQNYKSLQMDPEEKYFNSGLLLIDLEKWRAQNITDKTMRIINDAREYARLTDQYGLNVSLYKNWKELDPLWNTFCTSDHTDPYLIHYFGRKPIYKTYNNNYLNVFVNHLNQTHWKGLKPINETNRYIKKIRNVLQKVSSFLSCRRSKEDDLPVSVLPENN